MSDYRYCPDCGEISTRVYCEGCDLSECEYCAPDFKLTDDGVWLCEECMTALVNEEKERAK